MTLYFVINVLALICETGVAVAVNSAQQATLIQSEAPVRRQSQKRSMLAPLQMVDAEKYHLSRVSARWPDQVVYAVFTSSGTKYHDSLKAQMETWASIPHEQGRFVVVGGRSYPKEWQEKNILTSNCEDSKAALSCKEATLIIEGAARNASWLFIHGEDNYIDTDKLEALLHEHDADKEPKALGIVGCAKQFGYCPRVSEVGGFCGGGGYALNRAALHSLVSQGLGALREEYKGYGSGAENDIATSCALNHHGIELTNVGHLGFNGFATAYKKVYLGMIKGGFTTLHYISPVIMRWIHNVRGKLRSKEIDIVENGLVRKVANSTKDIEILEEAVFEGQQCDASQRGTISGNEQYWNCKKEYPGAEKTL